MLKKTIEWFALRCSEPQRSGSGPMAMSEEEQGWWTRDDERSRQRARDTSSGRYRWVQAALIPMGLIAATSTFAMADPFDAKAVPAEAKWVIHIDVDAVAKSAFWPLVEQRINANPDMQAGIQKAEIITGANLPQDLHSITFYGLGFNEADGVILAKARINQQQLLAMLQMNPSFISFPHGEHEVVSWEDKGKIMHGAFFSTDRVVISQAKENVEKALDILDGKGDALKADSVMAQPTGAGVLAGIASDAVAELAKKPENKNNPVFTNLTSAWITLAQQDQNVTLKGTFGAADQTKAQQLKTSAEGLKALGMMLASNENADPKLKMIAPLLPPLEITSQGANVMMSWTMPFTQVQTLIAQIQAAKAK